MLAIDKPAGLPMHTTAKFWRNTLVAVLRERYPDEQMEIAHRIDRETSGVLLIARGRGVASFLTRAFARRAVEKTYLALVKGHPPDEGRIDLPLRLLDTKSRVMMGPARGGESGLAALTQFRVLRRLPGHALCEARPLTGRQHQIRVHFAAIGHPIVGDKLYGAGEALFMRACEEPLTPELLGCFDGLPRHALHAHRLTFPHPVRQTRPSRSRARCPPTWSPTSTPGLIRSVADHSLVDVSSTREMLRSMRLTSSPASDMNSSRLTPSLLQTLRSVASSTSARARAIQRDTVDWLTL